MNHHTQDYHTYPVQPTLKDQETSHYIPLISSYEKMVADEMKQNYFTKPHGKQNFKIIIYLRLRHSHSK